MITRVLLLPDVQQESFPHKLTALSLMEDLLSACIALPSAY